MFSTILKEFTGYFDKRALISAFFPAMIFWGLTIILVLLFWLGWKPALETWNKIPGTVQVLLLLSFFIWVAFWTFLTLNFHSLLLRVYEGYWPIDPLVRWRRKYWQKRWDAMDQRDVELGELLTILSGEDLAFTAIQRKIKAHKSEKQNEPSEPISGKIALNLNEVQQNLTTLKARIVEIEETQDSFFGLRILGKPPRTPAQAGQPQPTIYEQLAALGKLTRDTWNLYLEHVTVQPDEEWKRYRKQLEDLSGALVKTRKELANDLERQILDLHQKFFLMLPPYRQEVVPTGLGNVLKAAESRVRLRYEMDAVLTWSRMEPLLPKETAESLQNAKTSLDLMLTLSASLMALGVPLSFWLMMQTTKWFRWWVPLIVLLFALIARWWVAAVPAAIAVIISLFLPVNGASAQRFLSGTEVVFTVFAALSFMSWVCYQNAMQSCLAYGEKIQAVFDLYRWKLLDELHLQLPPNLTEERETWKQVGELLYRGYVPSSDYYRYVKDEKKTKAPVVAASTAPAPPSPPPVPDDHVAVGVEVGQADILGGKLEPGNHVDVIVLAAFNASPVKYEDVVVLEVVSNSNSAATNSARPQPVVVVSVPRITQDDFIIKTRFGKVILTKRPEPTES